MRKRPKGQPKKYAERRHAKRRARERYGLMLNRAGLRECVAQIQNETAKFLKRQSNARSLWVVQVGGIAARVVYDKRRGEIITFLPPEVAE